MFNKLTLQYIVVISFMNLSLCPGASSSGSTTAQDSASAGTTEEVHNQTLEPLKFWKKMAEQVNDEAQNALYDSEFLYDPEYNNGIGSSITIPADDPADDYYKNGVRDQMREISNILDNFEDCMQLKCASRHPTCDTHFTHTHNNLILDFLCPSATRINTHERDIATVKTDVLNKIIDVLFATIYNKDGDIMSFWGFNQRAYCTTDTFIICVFTHIVQHWHIYYALRPELKPLHDALSIYKRSPDLQEGYLVLTPLDKWCPRTKSRCLVSTYFYSSIQELCFYAKLQQRGLYDEYQDQFQNTRFSIEDIQDIKYLQALKEYAEVRSEQVNRLAQFRQEERALLAKFGVHTLKISELFKNIRE